MFKTAYSTAPLSAEKNQGRRGEESVAEEGAENICGTGCYAAGVVHQDSNEGHRHCEWSWPDGQTETS